MATILDYDISAIIHHGENSIVYRGIRNTDKRPVILKMLNREYPSPAEVISFSRSYEILRSLEIEGVDRVYGLEEYQNRPVVVQEDIGGESLATLLLSRKLSIREFLRLATKITAILAEIHRHQVIHKNINPSNIIWNPENGKVRIIDFCISTRLSSESSAFLSPNILEGTLAYMSPEQTGRTNRYLDYRTDFYSLGATLYFMLSGGPPFQVNDPLELIHCHLARHPIPLYKTESSIPKILSDIVEKLLSKNAELRYKSAHGLKDDLEICLNRITEAGDIASFDLGENDFSDKFVIPQKLYGREKQMSSLLTAFERTLEGQVEVAMVSGSPGIGKTTLINEIRRPVTHRRGYFCSGKFDQYKRDIPYSAFVQAFRELINQVLAENEARLAKWKGKLLEALGQNGRVIVDVIPELELIIGQQPEVPKLAPREAKNRFNICFRKFIRVFGEKETPLVLFLDDLQWADSASFKMIELFVEDTENRYQLFIGAYRDNETGASHPLWSTLNKIQESGTSVNHIRLGPFTSEHLSELVVETFNCEKAGVEPLVGLLLNRVGGNPFFLRELLQNLYSEKMVFFNHGSRRWLWDLGRIRQKEIPEEAADLMASNIRKLPTKIQDILKLASCLGNKFDVKTLSQVLEEPPESLLSDLRQAAEMGIITLIGAAKDLLTIEINADKYKTDASGIDAAYRFLHDHIQQAAYSLLPEREKKETHLNIGRILLHQTPAELQAEKVFDIVNQLNSGMDLIDDPFEREVLAGLNITAGKKAKSSTAYETALMHFTFALDQLGENGWKQAYDLMLDCHLEAAEAAYLSIEFERMDQLVETVFNEAKTLLDKVPAYEVKIEALKAQNKLQEAVKLSLEILSGLGIKLPNDPKRKHILTEYLKTKVALLGKDADDLIKLPIMEDDTKLAAIRLLSRLGTIAYINVSGLFPLLVFKAVALSVKHGNSPWSSLVYVSYGLILSGVMGDVNAGYRFGQLAIEFLKQSETGAIAGTHFVFNTMIRHWKEPLKNIPQPLYEAHQIALETGDMEYMAYCKYHHALALYNSGKPLQNVADEMTQAIKTIRQVKQLSILSFVDLQRQILLNLTRRSEKGFLLGNEVITKTLQDIREADNLSGLFTFCFHYANLCYLFQEYDQANSYILQAGKYLEGSIGLSTYPLFFFYDSLIKLTFYSNSKKTDQKKIKRRIKSNQKKLKKWSEHAPENYYHKYYLVEAELARALNKDRKAGECYNQAIVLAKQHEYLNEEALSLELVARFHLSRGQSQIGHYYLKDAHYAYQRWGAMAKVDHLEKRYPQLVSAPEPGSQIESAVTLGSSSTGLSSALLDFNAVLKASEAISREMNLDDLLVKVMKIIIESAGAQTGYLLLEKDQGWFIEAEAAMDGNEIVTSRSVSLDEVGKDRTGIMMCQTIVRYVIRTSEQVILDDAENDKRFSRDEYILRNQPKSILCLPLLNQGKTISVLYLENNTTAGAFTGDRLILINSLTTQMAISIHNAKLYQDLQAAARKMEDFNSALKEKNEELLEFDRLKDEFLANTSHELRTPLHGIIGVSEALQNDAGKGAIPALKSGLETITSSGKRLASLVDDILDFSKLRYKDIDLDLQPVSLPTTVDAVLSLSRPLARSKNLKLVSNLPVGIPAIHADRNRLQQILHNLVGNAVKFTQSGKVEVKAEAEGSFVKIQVSDTGIGIPVEKLTNIFKSFEQIEASESRSHGGIGLGLSISRELVESHKGEIWVESKPGVGSDFFFTIPISKQPLDETPGVTIGRPYPLPQTEYEEASFDLPATEDIATGKENATRRILAVDDDPVNHIILRRYLSGENYSLMTAADGMEALKTVEKAGKPDLILLDVMMPNMSGLKFCSAIREKYPAPTLPIIFLTARNQLSDLVEAFSLGANDYLTKPFSREELLTRINNQLQHLEAHERLASLRAFSGEILKTKDPNSIMLTTLQTLFKNLGCLQACLFQENTLLLKESGNTNPDYGNKLPSAGVLRKLTADFSGEIWPFNHIDQSHPLAKFYQTKDGIEPEGSHQVFVKPQSLEEYTLVLHRNKEAPAFTETDIEYIRNILHTVESLRGSIHKLMQDASLIKTIHEIHQLSEDIVYIESKRNSSIVYTESRHNAESQKADETGLWANDYLIPMQGIQTYFP